MLISVRQISVPKDIFENFIEDNHREKLHTENYFSTYLELGNE